MNVTVKKKTGEEVNFDNAYDVYYHEAATKSVVVLYPDELDHGVEAEMEYRSDDIDRIIITF